MRGMLEMGVGMQGIGVETGESGWECEKWAWEYRESGWECRKRRECVEWGADVGSLGENAGNRGGDARNLGENEGKRRGNRIELK